MKDRQTSFLMTIVLIIGAIGIGLYLSTLPLEKSTVTELTQQPQLPDTFRLSSEMVPGVYQFLATQSAVATQSATLARAALVSHHLLAAPLINETLQAACQSEVATVVLVSPDHFGYLRRELPQILVGVSNFDWQTPHEVLPGNQKLTLKLAELAAVKMLTKPAAIGAEHGVFALIPFIEKWCGSPQVVGLIVRPQNLTQALEVIGTQTDDYAKVSQQSLLLVVSSDFTHEESLATALRFDEITKQQLMRIGKQNTPDFSKITSDCPACLIILNGYFSGKPAPQITKLNHQTSVDYGGFSNSVTSYFGAVWQ